MSNKDQMMLLHPNEPTYKELLAEEEKLLQLLLDGAPAGTHKKLEILRKQIARSIFYEESKEPPNRDKERRRKYKKLEEEL